MNNSDSQTAVVTGSTRGLGLGIAQSLLARGVNVVISGPRQEDCDLAVEKLVGQALSGARVTGIACDVRDEANVQALWDRAVNASGPVGFWLNNAGLALSAPKLEDLTSEDFRMMLEVNLLGAMHGCKIAMAGMKSGGGAIYNMLGAGWNGAPVPGMIGYATSKAGLTFMDKSLAQEVEGSNILVGSFAPGVVITEGFFRENAKSPKEGRAARAGVLNIIGDHTETIADWVADTMIGNRTNGQLFSWLTEERIAERRAMSPPRDILSRYDLEMS
jgi:NAD(P)-dependent dehydrogenase (short-subunit alcohol dehydrogenase family)